MANDMKVPLMTLKGMRDVPVFLKREKISTYSIRNLRKKLVFIRVSLSSIKQMTCQ